MYVLQCFIYYYNEAGFKEIYIKFIYTTKISENYEKIYFFQKQRSENICDCLSYIK